MTNTTALAKPATVLSANHSAALFANGIAANVETRMSSDARQAIADLVRRAETVPASRAHEVTDVIGGRQLARELRGDGRLRRHQGQDRRVGETADSHRRSQCRGAASDMNPLRMHQTILRSRRVRPPRPMCLQLRGFASDNRSGSVIRMDFRACRRRGEREWCGWSLVRLHSRRSRRIMVPSTDCMSDRLTKDAEV